MLYYIYNCNEKKFQNKRDAVNTVTPNDNFIAPMVGEEGLMQLFKQAHSAFRAQEVGTVYSWSRFVETFLCEHTYHDATDAFSKKEHMHNLGIMRGLLEKELDLILPSLNELMVKVKSVTHTISQLSGCHKRIKNQQVHTCASIERIVLAFVGSIQNVIFREFLQCTQNSVGTACAKPGMQFQMWHKVIRNILHA